MKPTIFISLLILLLPFAFAASTEDLAIRVNISDYKETICYYNGTAEPFDCFHFHLDDYNLSLNYSLIDKIEVPFRNESHCNLDGMEINVMPPDLPSYNFTCNPSITCPSIPNTSCSPSLTCPELKNDAELACINSLGAIANPPKTESSFTMPDWDWGTILIAIGAIVLVWLGYNKLFGKKGQKGQREEEYEYEEPVMERPRVDLRRQEQPLRDIYETPPRESYNPSPQPLHPDLLRALDELKVSQEAAPQPRMPEPPVKKGPTPEELKAARIKEIADRIKGIK